MNTFRRVAMLALIMFFWFCVSFITNILGPVIPDMMQGFALTDFRMVGFIPTFFFLAYAFMSIPSGMLVDFFGEQKVLFVGFLIPFLGALLFALNPTYPMLLGSCFIMGLGMAMLQTVLNPLQRAVGGEAHYAFVAELAQLMFGIASFCSPLIYTYLILHLQVPSSPEGWILRFFRWVTPSHLPWVSLYWIFVAILGLLAIVVLFVRFPRLETVVGASSGSRASYLHLFKQRYVWLYFLGILAYVSSEQSISIYMSTFLERYHEVDPQTTGAKCVSYFWGSMTIGCIAGMILLKLFDSRKILIGSSVGALGLLVTGLYGPTEVAIVALPSIGFFASMMYSIIFSLALNSVTTHHGSFAGILCSAIVGGAVGPLFVGILSDFFSLRISLLVVVISLTYIFFIGWWANPLINNQTIDWSKRFGRNRKIHHL